MTDDYRSKYEALVSVIVADEGEGIYPLGHLTNEQREAFRGTDAFKYGWDCAIIEGAVRSRKLLELADNLDEDRMLLLGAGSFLSADGTIVLNMNDTWAWATSWLPEVPSDQVPEVARLFRTYGYAGLYYWHSKQENDMRSAFHDVNRMVDFVRHEEQIRKDMPSSSARARYKATYVVGAE